MVPMSETPDQSSEQESMSSSRLEEAELVAQVLESAHHTPVATTLRTSARVLARVTDGIYRQPGSALRELISNAYDADASKVIIRSDRPRFDRMVIEDDGSGMSLETLAYLLNNIGGSAKRTSIGKELGVTSVDNQSVSLDLSHR